MDTTTLRTAYAALIAAKPDVVQWLELRTQAEMHLPRHLEQLRALRP